MLNLGFGLAILTVTAWTCAVGWLAFAAVVLYGLAQRKPLPATSISQLTKNPPLVATTGQALRFRLTGFAFSNPGETK
jgi:hypothetical protein